MPYNTGAAIADFGWFTESAAVLSTAPTSNTGASISFTPTRRLAVAAVEKAANPKTGAVVMPYVPALAILFGTDAF